MIRVFFLVLLPFTLSAQSNSPVTTTVAFLASLHTGQKSIATFPFSDTTRYEWHYLPASQIKRYGLCLKELDTVQHISFYTMLKQFLSDRGYERSRQIMDYENLLKELEPRNPGRIPENYFVAFYGNPTDRIWGWRLTGHHLTLNFTFVNGELAFAPFFFGVYPASLKEGPNAGQRLIKEEEDLGFELVNSMTPAQRSKAVFQSVTFNDIQTTNAKIAARLDDSGIYAKELSRQQKMILEKLIVTYLSSMPEAIAGDRMKRVRAEAIEEILFAWAGGTEPGVPHYYRIQGKSFLIEFDNSQHNANHIHTVWRDFNGDFGEDLLKAHYQEHKH